MPVLLTRNDLNPMLIRSGVKIILIDLPTESKSNTISFIAKSNRSCAMNWIILTKILSGVSRGTTAFDPFGNSELTIE